MSESWVVKNCYGAYVGLISGNPYREWANRSNATRFARKTEAIACRDLVVAGGVYARNELKIVKLVRK